MKHWEHDSKYLNPIQDSRPRKQVRTQLGPKLADKQAVENLNRAGDIALGGRKAKTEVRIVEARKARGQGRAAPMKKAYPARGPRSL